MTNDSCPYLIDVESDLQSRDGWNKKDDAILGRRLGKRPKSRNTPYPGAPNTVDPVIDDLTRDKTDQEISMIWNAPEIAYFIPLDEAAAEIAPQAQKGFNTYLRHMCGYRQKKEEAVDTKNARGFAITKQIREETAEWGEIPSFETVDLKDLIVSGSTKNIQNAERVCHVLRMSLRDLKGKPANKGWNRTAVAAVVDKLTGKDGEGKEIVHSSSNDKNSTFTVTKALIGVNSSDIKRDEVVAWEICHYATEWDAKKSGGIVSKGDKCIATVSPDVPDQLLHIVRWKENDTAMDDESAIIAEMASAEFDGRDPDLMIPGKDRPWPYVQHRYENRSRLWYDSRGIGQLCMDDQIIATAVQNGKLVQLDYTMSPVFEGGDGQSNQQNVVLKPGAVLPNGVKHVQMKPVDQSLSFEADYRRRVASQRSGSGGSTYSAEVSASRKLQKTAEEVSSQDAKGNLISSASADRFNDADRELFPMLWNDLKEMGIELPMIGSGMKFEGIMPLEIYDYKFLIIPAASDKTLNPDMQFRKDAEVIKINADYAETSGADIGAGMKSVTEKVSPALANALYPDPNSGKLAIGPTILELQETAQQLAEQIAAVEQKADQSLQLGSEVASAL